MSWLVMLLVALAASLTGAPAWSQSIPTNNMVRFASLKALERLGDPSVEIITQGSWNKLQGYNDPRFPQMIGGASDHDMRVFLRGEKVPAAKALDTWKKYRQLVEEELGQLVTRGVLRADELLVVRRSINIYPPEQLMASVNSAEDAMGVFQSSRTFPNLVDTGLDNARGSYGAMMKFERQGFETGERVMVLTLDKGKARFTALSDLNHMFEGHGLRKPLNLAVAAGNNLDEALHSLRASARNLKDIHKYVERANTRLAEAKKKMLLPATANDAELKTVTEELTDLKKRFDAIEPKPEIADVILGNRTIRAKTAKELADQAKILDEVAAKSRTLERVLQLAEQESLIVQNAARAIDEGRPIVTRFYRWPQDRQARAP